MGASLPAGSAAEAETSIIPCKANRRAERAAPADSRSGARSKGRSPGVAACSGGPGTEANAHHGTLTDVVAVVRHSLPQDGTNGAGELGLLRVECGHFARKGRWVRLRE